MNAFHEVRLSAKISYGATGGPMRRTDIVTLANGFEERNSPWAHPRHKYDISYGVRNIAQAQDVVKFFQARYAQLYGFRYKDWGDYKTCASSETVSPLDTVLGISDGITRAYQLVKVYEDAAGTYTRTITKPVEGTVVVAIDGVTLAPENYMVDYTTGWIVLLVAAPDLVAGASITAGFEFDVPVRFDTDWLSLSLDSFELASAPSIPLLEIKTTTVAAPTVSDELEAILAVWSASELAALGNIVDYTVNIHWETTWI